MGKSQIFCLTVYCRGNQVYIVIYLTHIIWQKLHSTLVGQFCDIAVGNLCHKREVDEWLLGKICKHVVLTMKLLGMERGEKYE